MHLRQLVSTALLAIVLGSCKDTSAPSPPNPVPGLDELTPSSGLVGSAAVTIALTGSDFVRSSVVRWNDADLPTTFRSATELTAVVDAPRFSTPGSFTVSVFNPAPGGGRSNARPFTIQHAVNPVPILAAVAPAAVPTGAAATITITGSSFVPRSSVALMYSAYDYAAAVVEFVSPTTLRASFTAAQLANAGNFTIRVGNPWPGGGSSGSVAFAVTNPAPTLTSLSPRTITAGTPGATLELTGTGYVAQTQARLNGALRPTTIHGPTRATVAVSDADLRVVGTMEVTVTNPGPGGGTSGTLTVSVTAIAPTIVGLPSQGATAGRPGFSLAVDGTHFVDGATVLWGGQKRPTTVLTSTRLTAAISSDDVATARTAEVTVRNPGVATASNAVTFTVRSFAAAALASARSLAIPAADVVYSPRTGLLYASVPSSGGTYGNSIVAIDPLTGMVTKSVYVGSEPETMALSEDEQFLHVSLRGSSSIRRVTVATLVPGLEFSLGAGHIVEEMLALPGLPRSVVVSKRNTCCSPRHTGVTVFDDGLARSASTPGHTGANSITFAGRTAEVLYGYNNETTSFDLFAIALEPAGARTLWATGGLVNRFYSRIHGAAGRVYTSNGSVIDPERRARVATILFSGGDPRAVAIAPELGRIFDVSGATLSAYDLNNYQLLGSVSVPGAISDHPYGARVRLVRWDRDGFAWRDGASIHLVRSTLAQ